MDNLMQALSGTVAIFLVGPVLLQALAVVYIALRIRDLRGDNPDPQVGIKAAYHFFLTFGILLILSGLTVIFLDMMQGSFAPRPMIGVGPGGRPIRPGGGDEFFNEAKRAGTGLTVSGMLVSVFFLALILAGTNDRKFPTARRCFVGLHLAISGTIVIGAVTVLMVTILQKDPKLEIFEGLTAILLVWGPTATLHLILLRVYSDPRSQPTRRNRDEDEDRRRDWDRD